MYPQIAASTSSDLLRRLVKAMEKLPDLNEFFQSVTALNQLDDGELKKLAGDAVQARAAIIVVTLAKTKMVTVAVDAITVDEGSQVKASEGFGGLPFANTLVVLGDRRQLESRVHSTQTRRRGNRLSLLVLCAR